MSSDELARYRDLIAESTGGFDPNKILSYLSQFPHDKYGVSLEIPVDQTIWGGHITVESIGMYVGIPDKDGWYTDGTLSVNYSLNDPTDEDEPAMDMDDAMDLFYSKSAYDDELKAVLMAAGFSREAASDVGGSESGMQDEGVASYDATGIADEVRKAIESVPSSSLAITIGLGTLNANGFDPKSADFESKKDDVIRWLLKRIKAAGTVPFDAKVSIEALVHFGIKWPELRSMLKSLGSEQVTEGDEETRIAYVSKDGHRIRGIKDPSEAVKIAAMNQNGYALQHIKDQSTAVQMAAISNDPNSIEFIKKMDPSVSNDPEAKKTIMLALLRFIKEGSDADISTPDEGIKNVGMGFINVLRRSGCRWPELDIIENSLRIMPDPDPF